VLAGSMDKLETAQEQPSCGGMAPGDKGTPRGEEKPGEQTLGGLINRVKKFLKGKRHLREDLEPPSGDRPVGDAKGQPYDDGALKALAPLVQGIVDKEVAKFKATIIDDIEPLIALGHPQPKLSLGRRQVWDTMAFNILGARFSALHNSELLTDDHRTYLTSILQPRYSSARLLLNSRIHGGYPEVFHALCDAKGPTLVIAKSGQYVAGGVNDSSWNGNNLFRGSFNTFVFSLNQQTVYPINLSVYKRAIRDNMLKGPCFTDALEIGPDFRQKRNWSTLGTIYGPNVKSPNKKRNPSLFGTNRFAIDEYEVYQLL